MLWTICVHIYMERWSCLSVSKDLTRSPKCLNEWLRLDVWCCIDPFRSVLTERRKLAVAMPRPLCAALFSDWLDSSTRCALLRTKPIQCSSVKSWFVCFYKKIFPVLISSAFISTPCIVLTLCLYVDMSRYIRTALFPLYIICSFVSRLLFCVHCILPS